MARPPSARRGWPLGGALPAYWLVGPVTFNTLQGMFSFTARAPHPGRGKMPVTASGAGETEIAALVDLHARLTRAGRPLEDPASESCSTGG
jgi:hypothetical protein